MRILITGGAGFIGSHLAERLSKDGHEIFILDDLNDFYAPALKRQNLVEVERAGLAGFYDCDIRNAERTREILVDLSPGVVIHLAARGGVRQSLEQPLLYEEVNVRGTLALLEASRIAGVRKFIFASSSSVYGTGSELPFREDDLTQCPISPYAATKIAGEKICFVYSHLYGLDVVCLRLFTVYGPRQRPDLAICKFAKLIDAGREIQIHGDGQTSRDYTYIDDVINGIVASVHLGGSYDVFNLGSACPVSLETVIETLEQAFNTKAKVRRIPSQPGDVPVTYADVSKARAVLGYQPCTPFHTGVQNFVQWYRDNRKKEP
jgi:UDP-glucuronate 4-epimerase